ncbi:MAG: ester cyclase [Deltaproteobacteria bacterium]|nr:ester cyclase [Deltaproteobacteria bacterium]
MTTTPLDIAAQFWRRWNERDWAALTPLLASDYRHHVGDRSYTLAQFRTGCEALFAAMPDYQIATLQVIADGALIAVRWRGRGSHVAPYRDEAPTNTTITIHGMHVHRVTGAAIAEDWESVDLLGMARQMGLRLGR